MNDLSSPLSRGDLCHTTWGWIIDLNSARGINTVGCFWGQSRLPLLRPFSRALIHAFLVLIHSSIRLEFY